MANEINLSINFNVQNGAFRDAISFSGTVNESAQGVQSGTVAVPTGGSNVPITLTTPGYCYVQNLDNTNFVSYGTTAVMFAKIKAGEAALFRLLPGGSLRFQADTATASVYYKIYAD